MEGASRGNASTISASYSMEVRHQHVKVDAMPPGIVDSEDEDDEILVPDDRSSSREAFGEDRVAQRRGFIDVQALGVIDYSLKQQQEGACCDKTAAQISVPDIMSATPSSSTLTLLKAKRRHTHTIESRSKQDASADRAVKRARTMAHLIVDHQTASHTESKTYLTGRHREFDTESAPAQSDGLVDNSDNMRVFEDQSRDTMQEHFVNHEPAVMFRDTGSTIPDNESVQQQWLEEAISKTHGCHGSPKLTSMDSKARQSSSFPWSASIISTPNGCTSPHNPDGDCAAERSLEQTSLSPVSCFNNPQNDSKHHVADTQLQDDEDCIRVGSQKASDICAQTTGSPQVQIPLGTTHPTDAVKYEDHASPIIPQDHECEIDQEAATPASSDDVTVGLPKELYKPRLSRRRATCVAEEPIDYSIVPEKAAKKRRQTTVDANGTFCEGQQGIQIPFNSQIELATSSKGPPLQLHHDHNYSTATHTELRLGNIAFDGVVNCADLTLPAEIQAIAQAPDSEGSTGIVRGNDSSFKVPPGPASPSAKVSSAKRTRRHHTTIFEDHVDFVESQRSPSLKQQQASRKSALKDLRNDHLQSTAVCRESGGVEVEDASEELTVDRTAAAAPAKRRGRPRKSDSSSAKVMQTVDELPGDTCIGARVGQGEGERATALLNDTSAESLGNEPPPPPPPPPQSESCISKASATDDFVPTEAENGDCYRTSIPAPPAEGPVASLLDAAPVLPPQGSPTSHSPIKSSLKVPLRVGLSRHQRIPPLLRVMRPPKQ